MKIKIKYGNEGIGFKVTPAVEEKKLYDSVSANVGKVYTSAREFLGRIRFDSTLDIKVKKSGE